MATSRTERRLRRCTSPATTRRVGGAPTGSSTTRLLLSLVVAVLLSWSSSSPRESNSAVMVDGFSVRPATVSVPRSLQKPATRQVSSVLGQCCNEISRGTTATTALRLSSADDNDAKKGGLPFFLDPSTKGGVVFYTLALFVVPILAYQFAVGVAGVDYIVAGRWIGIGFTVACTLAWVSTYIFRVATKDMTYAKQLKDYENAVIAKRLEELDEDEIQALVEEVEVDDF